MPIYEYKTADEEKGCKYCRPSFEFFQNLNDAVLAQCPKCSAAVKRIISAPAVGSSKTTLDQRAKDSGFHKLKKVDKGKYEKLY